MSKIKKTNAMRRLDQMHITYLAMEYPTDDGKLDGASVAQKIGKPLQQVFKTLVTQGASRSLYVFVIPVAEELDLKKAAEAAHEKKVEMLPVKELLSSTGYVKGGCSPIGMKKQYPTFIDASCLAQPMMVVSGGKIGVQIELSTEALQTAAAAEIVSLTK